MRSLALVSLLLASSTVAQASTFGIADSESGYAVSSADATPNSLTGKNVLSSGETVQAGESLVRVINGETGLSAVFAPQSTVQIASDRSLELVSGSLMTSANEFSIVSRNLNIAASGEQTSTAVVHQMSENELSINSMEGTLKVSDQEGKLIAELSKGESLVMNQLDNSWVPQPTALGAPNITTFLSEVADPGPQQTVEQGNDRRRLLPWWLIPVGVVAAGGATVGGIVVYNEVAGDDENNDNDGDSSETDSILFFPGQESSFVNK
jgi:hypothetical protein